LGAKSQIFEVEAMEFSYACWNCHANGDSGNLLGIGYLRPIEYIEFSVRDQPSKTPDLVFFRPIHESRKIHILMIDSKSGHVQRKDDLEREAKVYGKMSLVDVTDKFNKRLTKDYSALRGFSGYSVSSFSVAFQYYDNILNGASDDDKDVLHEIAKNVTILSCSKGNSVKIWGGLNIRDQDAHILFSKGIQVPKSAPYDELLPEKPCEEFIAVKIAQKAISEMARNSKVIFSARQLRSDYFCKLSSHKMLFEVMNSLNHLKFCTKKQMDGNPTYEDQEFEFTDFELLRNGLIAPLSKDNNLTLTKLKPGS
jgi:hypothetical protein